MGLDFLPNSTWNIHTHTHMWVYVCEYYVQCVKCCDELPRKDMKASCRQDLDWLADGLSVWLADISTPSKCFLNPIRLCSSAEVRWDRPGECFCPAVNPLQGHSSNNTAASIQACTEAVLFWIQCQFNRQAACAGGQLWLLRLQPLSLNHIEFISTSLLNCPPSSPPLTDTRWNILIWLYWNDQGISCLTKLINKNL